MWLSELMALGRGNEAVPIIDECIGLAASLTVQPNLSGMMNHRLKHFQNAKDAEGCRKTAELWETLLLTDAERQVSAARYRAVTAAVLRDKARLPEAAAEADKAMTWLQKAVGAGHSKLNTILKEADWDALRDRADFRQLTVQIQAANPKAD